MLKLCLLMRYRRHYRCHRVSLQRDRDETARGSSWTKGQGANINTKMGFSISNISISNIFIAFIKGKNTALNRNTYIDLHHVDISVWAGGHWPLKRFVDALAQWGSCPPLGSDHIGHDLKAKSRIYVYFYPEALNIPGKTMCRKYSQLTITLSIIRLGKPENHTYMLNKQSNNHYIRVSQRSQLSPLCVGLSGPRGIPLGTPRWGGILPRAPPAPAEAPPLCRGLPPLHHPVKETFNYKYSGTRL